MIDDYGKLTFVLYRCLDLVVGIGVSCLTLVDLVYGLCFECCCGSYMFCGCLRVVWWFATGLMGLIMVFCACAGLCGGFVVLWVFLKGE